MVWFSATGEEGHSGFVFARLRMTVALEQKSPKNGELKIVLDNAYSSSILTYKCSRDDCIVKMELVEGGEVRL